MLLLSRVNQKDTDTIGICGDLQSIEFQKLRSHTVSDNGANQAHANIRKL